MSEKACSRCKEVKTYEMFRKNRTTKDGYDCYCKACRKDIANPEYHKAYYQANKERCDQQKRDWTKKNEAKVVAARQERYASEREHLLEQKKEYYKKNRTKILEYKSSYQKVNRGKKNAIEAKRHASKLERTPKWLTKEQKAEIEQFYWLARDLYVSTGELYNVDHIVPLQGENVCGLHVPWNLQVLPSDVNIAKGNRFDGWKEWSPTTC
jgi:hypothetical protein